MEISTGNSVSGSWDGVSGLGGANAVTPDCRGSDSDYEPEYRSRSRQRQRPKVVPRERVLLRTAEKKARGRRLRRRYTLEHKAKALAYYDSLSDSASAADRETQTVEACKVHSEATFRRWKAPAFRLALEEELGCLISQFAPRVKGDKRMNVGGRGKRAIGRNRARIQQRRPPKFFCAEEQTYKWFLRQRKRGLAVGSRDIRNKMRSSVRDHGYENAEGFRASAGWFRRFFARYNMSWRRKNDNACKGLDELLPTVAAFINGLRVLRINNMGTPRRPRTRANSAGSARPIRTTWTKCHCLSAPPSS